MPGTSHTLPKEERLHGKTRIALMLGHAKWGSTAHLRYCFMRRDDGSPLCRLMVSVPKKCFKRAVKRNLIKRRLRESYRIQKGILEGAGVDFMLLYTSKEILESGVLSAEVGEALSAIAARAAKASAPKEGRQE